MKLYEITKSMPATPVTVESILKKLEDLKVIMLSQRSTAVYSAICTEYEVVISVYGDFPEHLPRASELKSKAKPEFNKVTRIATRDPSVKEYCFEFVNEISTEDASKIEKIISDWAK